MRTHRTSTRVRSSGRWPYSLPLYLLEPRGIGNKPNLFVNTDAVTSSRWPLTQRILAVFALTMSGISHAQRRAVDMVLQVANATILLEKRKMYRLARRWLVERLLGARQDLLDDFDDAVDPDKHERAADGTLYKAC